MPERFFSITAAFKRIKLDEAWSLAPEQANTLRETIAQLAAQNGAAIDITGGVQNSSSNGHSAGAFQPGQNQAGSQEIAEMWQNLLRLFDQTKLFLENCANLGLEAFIVAYQTGFQPPFVEVDDPVTLETGGFPNSFGRWNQACRQVNIPPDLVVDQAVNDEAIYVWMMTQELISQKQTRNDYWLLNTGGLAVPV